MLKEEKNTLWGDKASSRTRVRCDIEDESIRPGFLKTMINILRAVMEKADSIYEQVDYASKEMQL